MKKYITLLLVAMTSIAVAQQHTQAQFDTVVADDLAQYGASGNLESATTNTLTQAGGWTSLTNCTFNIPFVSGFEFVTNSTVRYTDGARWFAYSGSVGLQSTVTQTHSFEVGIETNGVYVEGSSSGPRDFDTAGQKGSVSFQSPVYLQSNDTIGLVIKINDRDEDVIVNTWHSRLQRF